MTRCQARRRHRLTSAWSRGGRAAHPVRDTRALLACGRWAQSAQVPKRRCRPGRPHPARVSPPHPPRPPPRSTYPVSPAPDDRLSTPPLGRLKDAGLVRETVAVRNCGRPGRSAVPITLPPLAPPPLRARLWARCSAAGACRTSDTTGRASLTGVGGRDGEYRLAATPSMGWTWHEEGIAFPKVSHIGGETHTDASVRRPLGRLLQACCEWEPMALTRSLPYGGR